MLAAELAMREGKAGEARALAFNALSLNNALKGEAKRRGLT